MARDPGNIAATALAYAGRHPRDILALALKEYAPDLALSFSGAEDVVLVDMAAKLGGTFRVFSLDTGRLHPETYQFIEKVRGHYGIQIDAFFPQPEAVQALVHEKGLFSFYRDGHKECCGIRKVEPLTRALESSRAWVTGQRKDQSPGTRSDVPVMQLDPTFGSADRPLVKFNPLSAWTSQQVWTYIRDEACPTTRCTIAASSRSAASPARVPCIPGQHEREGRWWWEEETKKECGLHLGNVK